jgi:hypothetical protein
MNKGDVVGYAQMRVGEISKSSDHGRWMGRLSGCGVGPSDSDTSVRCDTIHCRGYET